MRIKRFNENQQYLTDPFDPEESLEYNVQPYQDKLKRNFEYIANKFGLGFYIDGEDKNVGNGDRDYQYFTFYTFYKESEGECRFILKDIYPCISVELWVEDCKKEFFPKNTFGVFETFGEIEEYVKNYFKL